MKALISPDAIVASGCRIAEVSEVGFPVAPPFAWIECAADVTADTHFYSLLTNTVELLPPIPAGGTLGMIATTGTVTL